MCKWGSVGKRSRGTSRWLDGECGNSWLMSSFLSVVISVLLHGCLFVGKNGVSGLLTTFWSPVPNVVFVSSHVLMQTHEIAQTGIVMWKENMLKCFAEQCWYDTCVCLGRRRGTLLPCVQSLSKPCGLGCLLLWDRLVLAFQSCLCSQSAFGFFKVFPLAMDPSCHLKMWPYVFSAKSSTYECSQQHQMNPRQGFPQGNVLCTQLESVGGNSEPPSEVPVVKIQATDKSFLHLVQWVYLMLPCFWEAPLRPILCLKIWWKGTYSMFFSEKPTDLDWIFSLVDYVEFVWVLCLLKSFLVLTLGQGFGLRNKPLSPRIFTYKHNYFIWTSKMF